MRLKEGQNNYNKKIQVINNLHYESSKLHDKTQWIYIFSTTSQIWKENQSVKKDAELEYEHHLHTDEQRILIQLRTKGTIAI